MTEVAIRQKRWQSIDVYHDLDDEGEVVCHFGGHDSFRRVEQSELPDSVRRCQNCAGRGYAKGTDKQNTWASRLRAADDPEEVLAGNE